MKFAYRSILLFFAAIYLINLWVSLQFSFDSIEGFVMTSCLFVAVVSSFNSEVVHWAIGYNGATVFCMVSLFECLDNYTSMTHGVGYTFNFYGWRIEGIKGIIVDALPYSLLLTTTLYCLILDVSALKKIISKVDPPIPNTKDPIFTAPSLQMKINKKCEQVSRGNS